MRKKSHVNILKEKRKQSFGYIMQTVKILLPEDREKKGKKTMKKKLLRKSNNSYQGEGGARAPLNSQQILKNSSTSRKPQISF